MNDAWRQRAIQAILALSTLIVTAVLVYGVHEGTLTPGGAERSGVRGAGSGEAGGGVEGAAFDAAEQYGLLVTADGGRLLRSVDPGSGEISGEVELPGKATAIVPTPGGVSVWISFEGRSELEVYSTDSLEHEATVSPEGADGRNPEHLAFSQTGERLFVTWSGDSSVSVYNHEMRELTLSAEFDTENTEGALYRNRRATRLFRRTDDGTLGVFFARTGQRMGTVDISLSPDTPLRFNEHRTVLWGAGSDGHVHAVDEAEAVATRWDTRVSTGHAPVVLPDSGAPVFINEERSGLLRMPSWTPDDASRDGSARDEGESDTMRSAEPERLELGEVGDVAGTHIRAIEPGPGATVVVMTDAGELVSVDGERLEVLDVRPIEETGAGGQQARGEGDGEGDGEETETPDTSARIVSYVVRTEGNFACF